MWLLCLKMKAQIWGCLGQMAHRRQIAQWAGTRTAHPMAHRRQIAQWAGTRTTHPGGNGFEAGVRDRYLPKTRECVPPFPQVLFMPPKTRPRVFPGSACPHSRRGFLWPQKHAPRLLYSPKLCFCKNLGSACPHSRRGLLCPQKHAPRCFQKQK